jgi:hypothetical protein
MNRTSKRKGTHAVKFRLVSRSMPYDEWFSHKESNDIELLELQAHDIAESVDRWHVKQWEIHSSVDGGKTWQIQRNVRIH